MAKKSPQFILNKYSITFIAAVVWVFFFDKNNIFSQMELTHQFQSLDADRKYYLEEIEKNKSDIFDLQTNSATLEKFAREKYLMKKDNEDIFVIVEKK